MVASSDIDVMVAPAIKSTCRRKAPMSDINLWSGAQAQFYVHLVVKGSSVKQGRRTQHKDCFAPDIEAALRLANI